MSLFFYTLFLQLYTLGIRIASLWNVKARLWLKGRASQTIPEIREKCIWVHCSSLGEFEQGRPVIEAVTERYPQFKIVLTFFSPSGYEIRKNYALADYVLYLPMDGKNNAEKFIQSINPSLVIWVKYEYWYYYLSALKKKNIPVLLVSGIFRNEQPFFKSYGALWREMLGFFEHLFVQNTFSAELIETIDVKLPVTVAGDTRFDRVLKIAAEKKSMPLIEMFCNEHPVIVCGSTWDEDEEVLIHYAKVHAGIKFIIAPHEIDKENLADVKKEFKNAVFYSELNEQNKNAQVLIIDNIGMLSQLYRFATITYVGGGFRKPGIHNILEAAVYGKVVVFGPVYEKFDEAKQLIASGGAFSIETALQLEALLDMLFSDQQKIKKASEISGDYVLQNCGATEKIMDHIQMNRLLTN